MRQPRTDIPSRVDGPRGYVDNLSGSMVSGLMRALLLPATLVLTIPVLPRIVVPGPAAQEPPAPADTSQHATTQHDTAQVAADSAAADSLFHVTGDRLDGRRTDRGEVVVLTGNVVVTQGDFRARGDRGEYRKDEEIVTLDGNVLITERELRLRSHSARYQRLQRRLVAEGDVWLSDGNVEAAAPYAEYFRDEERAVLSRGAVYREEGREIRADVITYLRAGGELLADGSVVVIDRESEVRVEGKHAHWWIEEDHGFVTGRPLLVSEPDTTAAPSVATGDTTIAGTPPEPYSVLSDTLFVDRTAKRIIARGEVEFHQGDVEGSGAEAVFYQEDERTELRGEPRVRQGPSEMHGNRIVMTRRDGAVDRIFVDEDAHATYVAPDSLGGNDVPPSTIEGDHLTLEVRDDQLRRMIVVGNARVRYYPPPGEGAAAGATGKPTKGEWNETSGDTMTLGFDESRLSSVEVRGNARGTHHMAPESTAAPDSLAAPGEASGDTTAVETPDSSRYAGDIIEYDVASNTIEVRGKGEVEYGAVRLKAGDIHLNSATKEIRARSYPVLFDGQEKMLGRVMTYNLEQRRGSIYGGRARYETGYYDGQVVRKVDEDVLFIEEGRYTSCDHTNPHYAFRSRRMKVFVGDRVIARPLLLYVGKVPVLPLPFFLFPIAGDRRSGLLIPSIDIGVSQSAGRFIRHLGYYWVPNDYLDVKAWGDYFQHQRWVAYVETRYRKIYLLEGNARASYQRAFGTADRRYDLAAYHRHELGEDLTLTGRANFVSDRTYRQDIVAGMDERLNRELRSDIAIAKRWESGNINGAVDRRENLDTGVIDWTLPRVTGSLLRRPFFSGDRTAAKGAPWHRTFFYDLSGELRNQSSDQRTYESDQRSLSTSFNLSSQEAFAAPRLSYRMRAEEAKRTDSAPGVPTRAVDNVLTVGGSPKLRGWLELSPSATFQETWFNRGAAGQPGGWRSTWDARGSARTNLYGTFFPRWGRLVGIRHVMTPEVAFTYQPSFPQYDGRFQSVGGVGAGSYPGRRVLDLGLVNNLHLKVQRGEKAENLNNVASLRFNTSYDFRWREQGRDTGWSLLRSGFTVQPGRGTDLRVTTTHSLPDMILNDLSASLGLIFTGSGVAELNQGSSPLPEAGAPAPDWYLDPLGPQEGSMMLERPWSLSISQRYNYRRGGEDAYWLEGNAETSLLSRWRLAYSARFNLKHPDLIAQEWFIYRDLHCWEARFTRAFSNEEWRYYFRIAIKAHPEIHAERGEPSLSR